MDTGFGKGIKILYIILSSLSNLQTGLSEEFGERVGTQSHVFSPRVRRQSQWSSPGLKVTDFHIRCKVMSRYAFTTVSSSIWNQLSITKEAAFEVNLPHSAFISNFSITSNNKTYTAQVKERGVAKRIYDEAKRKGKAAGLVTTKERETEKFRVVVSIPAGARTSFSLSYEELLFRRLGHYELTLGLRPTQPVQNFSLEVTVMESTGISFIKVLPLRTSRLMSSAAQGDEAAPAGMVIEQTSGCAQIRYSPTWQQQTSTSPKGLNGDFILQYDVELSNLMGDIQIHDGYFVHYFAPRKLPVVPKNVIFAIDVSGSMIGTKIKQTKQAMATILGDLREDDFFNIITFSDRIHIWKNGGTVKAILSNVRDAQEFVKKITAEGWTDINSALLSAGQLVKSTTQNSTRRIPLVIFLTDGEATTGVTSSEIILRNARKALGSASLFGLAFGDDADFALLRRLALENRGVARMVYEDSDAALQLKGFYDEVASPLLSDIQLSYLDDQAFDVTRSLFPNYFQGSELVVTGRIKPGVRDLKVFLSAEDSKQQLKLENNVPTFSSESNITASPLVCQGDMNGALSFVQRLWAYFTIKELLRARLNSSDPAAQRLLAEKATNLSLKYNFVTPVTSLVVVKPDANEAPVNFSVSSSNTTATLPITVTTNGPSTSPNSLTHTPLSVPRMPISNVTVTKKPNLNSSRNEVKPNTGLPGKPLPSWLHNTSRPTQLPQGRKLTSPSTPERTNPSMKTSLLKTAYPHCCGKNSTPTPPSRIMHPVHPGKFIVSPSDSEKDTSEPSADPKAPIIPTHFHGLVSALPILTAAPSTDTGGDIENATLVAATFVPMPGVTERPKLEVSELLDVPVLSLLKKKDMDHVEDIAHVADYEYLYYDSELEASTSLSHDILFSSSVDGDPHFIVQLPRLNHSLCFTIDGKANDVLRLLEDPDKGIIVDGRLTWAPPKLGSEDRARTYFDQLKFSKPVGLAGGLVVTVTMDLVVVEGEGRETLRTDQPRSVLRQGVRVTVDTNLRCWVVLGRGLRFLVLFHHYKHPTYLQMAHLGFYLVDGQGLSPRTQGLLGQFQYAHVELVEPTYTQSAEAWHHSTTKLRIGASWISVSLQDKTLKDSLSKQHWDMCWVVARVDVEKLLGHSYNSYVVNQL
ncbi:inter-alpha-trypsin inhibitor heavy chain H6 isoform X2 [Brienomyrus brachyistius]|uniref:inter-alpha-trypsin inhibitor heavy chain H6 isoform X2 n=1 Tax=Brienomyrus brachyistius TaxID=42636 RepID=UPI0020B27AEA|nr:inter-alpha-trypsin inhibitor heavy chain H6 isoform X2 [Brienomyrus brachyistius]